MHHRRLMTLFAFISVMALIIAPATAFANVEGWADGKGGTASPKDFIPVVSDEEAYIARYTISVDLDGGGWIGTNFTISNLGLGDGNGAAKVRIELPERKDRYTYSKKVDRDEWSSKSSSLDLEIASVRLTAKDTRHFSVRFDDPDSEVKMELDFVNSLPMYRPGNGRIDVEDGYFAYAMLAPRASVSGRVFIDGKWREVTSSGDAFADHTATNIAPFNFAKRFSRFRSYEDDLTVSWREVTLDEDYGGKSLTWMMIGYKDNIIFSDADATMRTGRVRTDGQTGYRLPYAVQIDGEDGSDVVKIVLRGKKMRREDLLESYGSAAKMVAGAVSKPYRYSFPCRYTVQMKIQGATATVKGKGTYSFDFVNP